jgi:plasmid maintenance system killer protein
VKLGFQTAKLKKQCESKKSRRRAFGDERGKRLGRRLTALLGASSLEDLRETPGRLHELREDRAGQLSLDLDGPYRLIFEPVLGKEERPGPSGGLSWSQVTEVCILSIEDTHA